MKNNFSVGSADGVAGVLLAAGQSRRMGQPKQLLRLQGKPLIRWTAETMAGADFDVLVAVIPPGEPGEQMREALADLPYQCIENPDAGRGMLSSFRVALEGMPHVAAVQFALADMPLVTTQTHRAVLDAFRQTGAPVVVSEYGENHIKAPPHLFRADLFGEILALPDADNGPRPLLQKYAAQTVAVPRPAAELLDIDTPEALAAAQSLRE